MGNPRPLFHFFCLFKQTLQFLQQINVKKCPSSIQCWDLNTQPSEHESHPITTRPVLKFLVCRLNTLFYFILHSYQQTHFPETRRAEGGIRNAYCRPTPSPPSPASTSTGRSTSARPWSGAPAAAPCFEPA